MKGPDRPAKKGIQGDTVEVPADALYALEDAMLRLICEAIHYKDAKRGKQFLEKAVKAADEALSDWKQTRPAPMRVS